MTDLLGSDLVALLADVAGLEGLEEIIVLEGPPRPGCTTLTEFTARATDAHGREVTRRRAAVTADEASDIIFTSGTTGKPKGAVLGTAPVCAPTWPGPNWSAYGEATGTSWSIRSSTRPG